ncbi:DNA cytosine methyltransferase [Crocosphaera sp. Alani8]|uniref:DNA cytosine methyltransferase n=1 Tax=Crocosphaera sp. Alani8 TaxID=3038952 RepID=UPI00313CD39A
MKRLLSLFSGCGGMDLGFEGNFWVHQDCINETIHPHWIVKKKEVWVLLKKTNFDIVFANDIKKPAYNAWMSYFGKRNFSGVFYLNSLVDLIKLSESKQFNFPENIDIITGGFPCQDFSISGKRKGCFSHKSHTGSYLQEDEDYLQENRGVLYQWMIKLIEKIYPKVFVAENVKGLTSLSISEEIFQNFKQCSNQGYFVIPKVLYAPNFGIPQRRERLFLIGIKKGALNLHSLHIFQEEEQSNLSFKQSLDVDFYPIEYYPFPSVTHDSFKNKKNLFNPNLKPYTTTKKVLENLNEPEQEKEDLSQTKYSKAKFLGKGQGQIEIDLEGLSPTIRAEHHGNIEYRRLSAELGGKYLDELNQGKIMRRLTVRECARIQTFPDDFAFVMDKKSSYPLSASQGYKLIGNAVPPLLAYHIAKRLENLWDCLFTDD